MKKLIFALALIACASCSRSFIIDGRIANTTGKTRVVLYEHNGQQWDTAYVGDFRKHYSLVLDTNYRYQVWFISRTDSVKVLCIDRNLNSPRGFVVDVDFGSERSVRLAPGTDGRYFDTIFIYQHLTPANGPEDLPWKQ